MPTGHRNDMDDLTHPCHHLEESAHVLEYPHASLFAGYREWSNLMYQPSLDGLVQRGVVVRPAVDLGQVAVFGDTDIPGGFPIRDRK